MSLFLGLLGALLSRLLLVPGLLGWLGLFGRRLLGGFLLWFLAFLWSFLLLVTRFLWLLCSWFLLGRRSLLLLSLLLSRRFLLLRLLLGCFLFFYGLFLGCFFRFLGFLVGGCSVEFEGTSCPLAFGLDEFAIGYTVDECPFDVGCQLFDICVEIGGDVLLYCLNGRTILVLQVGDCGYNHVYTRWMSCWSFLLGFSHDNDIVVEGIMSCEAEARVMNVMNHKGDNDIPGRRVLTHTVIADAGEITAFVSKSEI